MIRDLALALVLAWSLIASAKQCPDRSGTQTTIGGDVLDAFVLRHADKPPVKAVPSAKVTVYSSAGKKIYLGATDKDGHFGTGVLPPDDYRVVVEGFGNYHVKLDPRVGRLEGQGGAFFTLWLTDHGCLRI